MTLTVLSVAYPLARVTSESVGGAEQVLASVDHALVAAGGTSIVIASDGSRTSGQLYATPAFNGPIDERIYVAARAAHAKAIDEVLQRQMVDLIHFHGVDYHTYLPVQGTTALATLHLAHCWYPAHAAAPTRPNTFVNCVSEWQRQFFPPSPTMVPTIDNGVPIPGAPVSRTRGGYALSLGRICPEKGFHHGLDAARRAGVKFRLAGQVFPYEAHEHYFATEIVPRLGPDAEFIGPVATEAKQRLLANARCLLVPSLVPETSSLVAMEAIAAGTPVIAFANGALAEIIDHGVTGFIVRSGEEMADAIAAVGDLDPEVCRTTAIVRFSREAMTAKYLTLYDTLVARTRTRAGPRPRLPISIASRRAHAVTELRDEAELRDIVPEWRALCASSDGTPFQRPEWLLPWWRRFGAGELRVLVVRYGSELVGLAPLYLRRGWQGDRELAFVGAGNTDYLDVITAPAHRDEVAAAVVDRIAGGHADWDGCALGPLPQRSPLLTALAPRGWTAPRTRTDVCPVLSVWGAHRDIMSTVRERQLAQLHYERRRLSREHAVDVREGSAATAAAMLAELCRLHTARWRDRGDGVLEDERTRAFHLDVVREMANAGILRLYTLTIDGRPAAAFYGFAEHRRWFYYLGGFDPAFRRYSVGSLVILHALEKAAGENATQFNFLRGAESYKYRWGAVDTSVYGLRLVRGTASATTRPREPIRAR